MADSSIYSRSGGDSSTPPPFPSNGRVSSSGQSFGPRVKYGSDTWQSYADKNGQVTSPPNYPDVSYGAYLRAGGNVLGIGYNSWKDQRLAAYNTAYNMYQQWYDSTAQQVSRIEAAGLNTNLAYGMATPGSSPGGALAQSSGPSPEQVFFGGVSALTGLAGGLKSLAEAATIVNELPESKLKGNIARMIDAGAKAGAINAENTYLGSLFGARNALGVGASKAQAEKAEAAYSEAKNQADADLISYMTTHNEVGEKASIESSIFGSSEISTRRDAILSYTKHRKEWDELLSNSEYWSALLDKAVGEGWISKAQGEVARSILQNEDMDNMSKMLALQPGLTGFFAKAAFGMTDSVVKGFKSLKLRLFGEDGKPFTGK